MNRVFACESDAFGDHRHAACAGAAMIVSDSENTGRDRGGKRLAVPGSGETRRGARWRAGPMIGAGREQCVQKPPFVWIGKPSAVEQKDSIGERSALHELRDVVAA